ncbi:hypothetical protein [Sanyastnella coralliicola]|uniref:hypothetical protein n=1 Tax=Sanyastnella coralliicola TaxID=3069118 RepID=UPI0027BAEAC8|nr:hypothetical protein [Longitalea sp. SCSIO 12813]
MNRSNVRISEQETYRLNESLMKKRLEAAKGKEESLRPTDIDEDLPTEPVTEEEMVDAWKLFSEAVNTSGRRSLFATLSSEEPRLEGLMIKFKIANVVQEKDMELVRGELMEFLRTRLQNFSLDLTVELNAQISAKMKFLTERDKYDQMVEKNPVLEELRKRLDLDLRQ